MRPLGFSLGLGLGSGRAAEPFVLPTQTETTAYLAAMSVQPSAAREKHINRFIWRLKNSAAYTGAATSIWAKLDVLYLLAAHTEQASLLNAPAPATYVPTKVLTPVFTVDRGWNGDGLTTALTVAFNLATASGRKYLPNDASMFCWSLTDGATLGADMGGNSSDRLSVWNSQSNAHLARAGTTTSASKATASGLGLSGFSRRASGIVTMFGGGPAFAIEDVASTYVGITGSSSTRILSQGTSYSARPLAVAGWGGAMSNNEILWLQFACEQYLRHCGAVA
jgi:hypothetical protein